MKNTLPILALAGLSLMGCSKETSSDKPGTSEPATDLTQVVIPQKFNWSSSLKGKLNIHLQSSKTVQTDGADIYVINDEGERLAHGKVVGNGCEFYVNLPQTEGSYFLYIPQTGDKKQLTGTGNISFKVTGDPVTDIEAMLANAEVNTKLKRATRKSSGSNLLTNGDFETNHFPSLSSTLMTGIWYKYNDNFNWDTEDGSKVWKAKNNKYSYIGQEIDITAGDSLTLGMDYYNAGWNYAAVFTQYLNSYGSVCYTYYSYLPNGKSTAEITTAIPSNAVKARIILYAYDKSWFDNVSAVTKSAILDADNDGVEDSMDEFPNDPSRAFTSNFPMAGTQKLAFEDSWPDQGDFDFNDLVIDNKIKYTLNSDNEVVDAKVTIVLQAAGAGRSSGLALNFVDNNHNEINTSIINTVSGASIDPDNTNGIIVYNDVFKAQSVYYTNTGTGADATPDTIKFSIDFNAGVSSSIIPDFYIYRTDARGTEVHLAGFSGSAAVNTSLFGTADDYDGSYKTEEGLPWALEVTNLTGFKHPLEKTDIVLAYPQFQNWAQSNGLSNLTWYLSPNLTKVY